MVVLGAAIVTKGGKVLLSRHFVELNRVRVEGLLGAFPKLIGSGTKQHTFVETDAVRYVYQPMDALHLLIMTNKSSNIIEDLETLRLLAKLIPEYCSGVDEDGIAQSQFELIAAFDEAIALGYRENVKPEQIRTFTEMDSHEEKLHNMIQQAKMLEAQRETERRAREFAASRRAGQTVTSGISSTSIEPSQHTQTSDFEASIPQPASAPAARVGTRPIAGMTLVGKPKGAKTTDYLNALKVEGELRDEIEVPKPSLSAAKQAPTSSSSVNIVIEEKVNVKLDREGGLQSVDVLGNLALTVTDQQYASPRLHCSPIDGTLFQLKVNPKVNKDVFNQTGVLELTDPSRGYPLASSQVLLKWRMPTATDDSRVPLIVNCWPSEISGGFSVNLDFELTMRNFVLTNVIIGIPLKEFGGRPAVIQVDGDAVFDPDTQTLLWHVDSISSSNTTGTLEFEVRGSGSSGGFFPINIAFASQSSYSGLTLRSVVDANTQAEIPHVCAQSLTADQYLIA